MHQVRNTYTAFNFHEQLPVAADAAPLVEASRVRRRGLKTRHESVYSDLFVFLYTVFDCILRFSMKEIKKITLAQALAQRLRER
jgi:hypothetical protein